MLQVLPDIIANEHLWQTTGQEKMELQIKRRRWGWLGHTLRKSNTNTTKQALGWNPQGERTREGGQGTASHGQWRGRWERQTSLKAKEHLATDSGGVDGRGRLHSRPRNS